MSTPSKQPVGVSPAGIAALAERLAPYLSDPQLLHLALAHRSYCSEVPGEASNERLEFLGDAVLGLVVTEHLYRSHPGLQEGDLARIRSAVVSSDALAPLARRLGVGEALLLGRGEANSGGRDKDSLLADALEALIGAAYLASGLAPAAAMTVDLLGGLIEAEAGQAVLGDAKNHLQELAAQLGLEPPVYALSDEGPDHDKRFRAEVRLGAVRAAGEGKSKKQAERHAAQRAVKALAGARSPDA